MAFLFFAFFLTLVPFRKTCLIISNAALFVSTLLLDINITSGRTILSLVTTEQTRKKVPVPFRRPGIFKAIPHKNSGFTDTWADWSSRTNQHKYFRVLDNESSLDKEDGLSTYWGELTKEDKGNNFNHLYVKS